VVDELYTGKIEGEKGKVAEIAEARDDARQSIKDGVDSARDPMRSAFSETVDHVCLLCDNLASIRSP
jgi:hypothetical protein